jgi:hypothetical protein
MQLPDHLYLRMFVCMYVCIYKWMAKEAGLKPCIYVCMSGWMCMGRREVLMLTSFAMVFLMHVYALHEVSHHGRTCEGKPIRQEDADGAQGSPTCSQSIARKKLLPARPLASFRIAYR